MVKPGSCHVNSNSLVKHGTNSLWDWKKNGFISFHFFNFSHSGIMHVPPSMQTRLHVRWHPSHAIVFGKVSTMDRKIKLQTPVVINVRNNVNAGSQLWQRYARILYANHWYLNLTTQTFYSLWYHCQVRQIRQLHIAPPKVKRHPRILPGKMYQLFISWWRGGGRVDKLMVP